MAGQSGRELVCETWEHVLFVDDDGQPEPSGGQVSRGGHVSAEAEDYVSLSPPQQSYRSLHRLKQARSEAQVLSGASRHRYRRNQLEFQSGRRDNGGLQPARRAERGKASPGRSRRSSRPVAINGDVCPAVPPPASTTEPEADWFMSRRCPLWCASRPPSSFGVGAAWRLRPAAYGPQVPGAQASRTPTASKLATNAEPP